jgi:hypothetical protein
MCVTNCVSPTPKPTLQPQHCTSDASFLGNATARLSLHASLGATAVTHFARGCLGGRSWQSLQAQTQHAGFHAAHGYLTAAAVTGGQKSFKRCSVGKGFGCWLCDDTWALQVCVGRGKLASVPGCTVECLGGGGNIQHHSGIIS